jgi:hypothetical protein
MKRHFLRLTVILLLCGALPAAHAQAGPDPAAPDAVAVDNSLGEAIRNTESALQRLEQEPAIGLPELEALLDRVRNSLDDAEARQMIQDAYYDALGMLDAAAEALRDQSRASAVSALETAIGILRTAKGRLAATQDSTTNGG